jgi:hypothetical protein
MSFRCARKMGTPKVAGSSPVAPAMIFNLLVLMG